MEDGIMYYTAVAVTLAVLFTLRDFFLSNEKIQSLREEVAEMRKERKVIDFLDCLLKRPETMQEVRENSTELFYYIRRINPVKGSDVEKALYDMLRVKIEENNAKMKAICETFDQVKEQEK